MILHKHQHVAGFTIIELMATVALLGILMALAVPSFQGFIANQRVKTSANDLLMAMLHARSEAVKRNTDVSVVPAGGDWAAGWCIYLDSAADKTCPYSGDIDADEAPYRQQDALSGIVVTTDNVSVTFGASGRLVGDSPSFDLCDTNNKAFKRQLTVGLTGAPLVKLQGACGS